jgi:hypothetical protein
MLSLMTLQQTIEIPADRKVCFEFDLPETASVGPGAAQVVLTITSLGDAGINDADRPAPGSRLTPRQLAAIEKCDGIAKGILTSDDILESRRKDKELEEAKWRRLYAKEGNK